MNWFKHRVASGDDPDIVESFLRFGSDGPWCFFRTLEIMAREFNIDNPGENKFPWEFFRKKHQISGKKVVKILEFFHKKNRIFFEVFENDKLKYIWLKCPKLQKDCDDYTARELRKKYGQSSDIGSDPSQTPETETETDLVFTCVKTSADAVPDNVSGSFFRYNGNHFSAKVGEYFESIVNYIHALEKMEHNPDFKPINYYQLTQEWINKSGHPGAIAETWKQYFERFFHITSNYQGYARKTFGIINGKYNARESERMSQQFKDELNTAPDEIKQLASGLFKTIE